MKRDLSLLHGRYSCPTRATVDKAFTYQTLQFIERGGVELFYDDRRYEIEPHWVWTAFPGPRVRFHAWPKGSSWTHRYMAFTGPRLIEWQEQDLLFREPQPVPSDQVQTFIYHFDLMLSTAMEPGRMAHLKAVNLLEGLLIDLASWRRGDRDHDRTEPPWLQQVQDELECFEQEPDYADLAQRLRLSINTFRRTFRAFTGLSPHRYRLAHRAALAKQLLVESSKPIKGIAEELNFTDVFYFTKQFKQEVGVTPAAYRKSRQG